MVTNKEIIEKVRKTFKVNKREWENLCFEGCYIREYLEEALNLKEKDLTKQFQENLDEAIWNITIGDE